MHPAKKLFLVLADAALLYAALVATLLLRYSLDRFPVTLRDHIEPFSLIFVVWIFVFYLADLYRRESFRSPNALVNRLLFGIFVSSALSIALFYLFGEFFRLTPKTNFLIFAGIFTFFDYLWRNFLRVLLSARGTPVVVIGESPRIKNTVSYLSANPHAGYRVALHVPGGDVGKRGFRELFESVNARMVVVASPLLRDPEIAKALYELLPLGVTLMHFPDFYELVFDRVPLDEVEEGWFVEHIWAHRPFYDALKRVIDFSLATIFGLILLLPALLIALIIKATSRGPVIFKQERIGKGGGVFSIYKFRTMRLPARGESWDLWTTEGDARITLVGRALRFAHLDEIPQLWNIVRGDISLTGPRPERIELAREYGALPYYGIRHIVPPGLTGWAQINYKPSASLEEAQEKLEYDIFYVKNRSFVLDSLIILRTIRYFFASHGK